MTADAAQGLHAYLEARRAEIDEALLAFLPEPPAVPRVLAEAMRYSLIAGGKRLRPLLTMAAADAIGGTAARTLAMPAACAIEMIHTYSLIHDDLPAMDDDTMRRGRPTLHVVAGEGMAILAGDGLQAEAFRLLARRPAGNSAEVTDRKLRVIELIAEAAGAEGMVGGQAIDLDAVQPGDGQAQVALTAADVEGMHARKTGAMIRVSAVAGAVMAGADEHVITAVHGYGTDMGLAFQIVDDILDIEAESSTLGKTAGKDAAAGKPTYPSIYGIAHSRRLAAACLARAQARLAEAGLANSHLAGIARSIVTRQS